MTHHARLMSCAILLTIGGFAVACSDAVRPDRSRPRSVPTAGVTEGSPIVVVTPDSMRGWAFIDDQRSTSCGDVSLCSMVDGPDTSPLGSGSASLTARSASDGVALALAGYGGTRLDQITELSYSTYRSSDDSGNNLAIALQITADFDLNDASDAWQGRLVFEPYLAQPGAVLSSKWQRWDTRAGKWWATRASVVVGGVSTPNPCQQASPCTWSQLLAAFPNVGVHRVYGSLLLKAGSGWPQFQGNVDALSITANSASTTYDFELHNAPTVPALPPDSLPLWIHDDTNVVDGGSVISGPLAKRIVVLAFNPGASMSTRAAAVASVGGVVVGGMPTDTAEGFYFVKVEDAISPSAILTAAQTVDTMPGVAFAVPDLRSQISRDFLRPRDDPAFSDWQVDADAADGNNWALERINAPLAWGCSVGDSTVRVDVLDWPFNDVDDLRPNIKSDVTYSAPVAGDSHGTSVASILAARGNNGTGMAGVMWYADLHLKRVDAPVLGKGLDIWAVAAHIVKAIWSGARVINLSIEDKPKNGIIDDNVKRHVELVKTVMRWVLRLRDGDPHAPLIVIAAGNDATPASAMDAYWASYPAIEKEFPRRVLVVAAASRHFGDLDWFSNSGLLVQIAAPGDQLMVLDELGKVRWDFAGTSGAAPYVSGVAGLLMAFDPNLSVTEVRDLIVAGAIAGGRDAAGIPLLNAYESLRLAAQRIGAPLCGNRVWVTDAGELQVQRSGFIETIGNPGVAGDYVYVQHGGRRVLYSTTDGDGLYAFEYDPIRGWVQNKDAWDLPDSLVNKVYGYPRASGNSHDYDSYIMTPADPRGFAVQIAQVNPPGGWQVGYVPRPADGSTTRRLVYQRLDYTVNGAGDTVIANIPYPSQYYGWLNVPDTQDMGNTSAAFSIIGDSIYLAEEYGTTTLHVGTSWQPCPETEYIKGYAHELCLDYNFTHTISGSNIQSLPASSAASANPNLPTNVLAWSSDMFNGRSLLWITRSDDGRELIVGDGIDDLVDGPTRRFHDCRIRWLDRRTGQDLYHRQSAHACESAAVGGVSPTRILAGGPRLTKRPRPVGPTLRSRGTPPSMQEWLRAQRERNGSDEGVQPLQ